MSSSHRKVRPCDATVRRDGATVGPMRLPMKRANEFVEEFNDTYQMAGLRIVPLTMQATVQTNPESGPSPQ